MWRNIDDKERENALIEPSYIFNDGMPTSYDLSWDNTTQKDFEILEKLNLSKHNPDINDCNQKNNKYENNPKQNKKTTNRTIND